MSTLARHWSLTREALSADRERVRASVRRREADFLPAALEIIERPVSPIARTLQWLLLGFLACALLWLVLGRVDVVASAPGRLAPRGSVKLVQPADAGIVRAILVQDGQRVRRGQPLIELDPTTSSAEALQAADALRTSRLDAARARAILAALDGRGLLFVAPPGTAPAIARTQASLAAAELGALTAGADARAADRVAARAAEREALTQSTKLAETLPLLDQQIEANEQLLAKGYVSKLKVIEMRRQRLATARDREAATATASRAAAQLSSAASAADQIRAEARTKVLGDLAKAEADILLRQEETVKAERRSTLQVLTAPVDGVIAQLAVHTIGGVVEAAKPLMVVVPDQGALVAEAKVMNKDAGFVRPGQHAEIKLDAFPFTRYGTVPGTVETVSSDAVKDEQLGYVFMARVRVNRAFVADGAIRRQIVPGMTAVTDIRIGRRTIGSYLTSPIQQATFEAGRER